VVFVLAMADSPEDFVPQAAEPFAA